MAATELDPGASPLALYGAELRRLREERGKTQAQVAAAAHVSKSLVSQIEHANRTPTRVFTEAVEEFLGLNGELARLWPLVARTASPTWFRSWPKIEGDAHTLETWQPLVVPGLLQTRAYARAILMGQPGITDEQVETALEARMTRQSIFNRPSPPMYTAVIDETVLDRPIGGPEVMSEQIDHLLKLLGHPTVTLQTVPADAVPTIGLLGGFVIARLPDGSSAVYLDSAADGEVTDRTTTVRTVNVRFNAIRSYARPVTETEPVLREKRDQYARDK